MLKIIIFMKSFIFKWHGLKNVGSFKNDNLSIVKNVILYTYYELVFADEVYVQYCNYNYFCILNTSFYIIYAIHNRYYDNMLYMVGWVETSISMCCI